MRRAQLFKAGDIYTVVNVMDGFCFQPAIKSRFLTYSMHIRTEKKTSPRSLTGRTKFVIQALECRFNCIKHATWSHIQRIRTRNHSICYIYVCFIQHKVW